MVDDFIKITDRNGLTATIPVKNLVELVNEGIFCVNAEGNIVFVNRQFCRNMGYSETELIGKSIFSLIYDQKHLNLSRERFELRKKGISDEYEIHMRKKNGEGVWIRVSGKPVYNDKGEFVGSLGVHSDITRQKSLEEELIFAKEDLETKVITRTRQLSEVNEKLQGEIRDRKLAEISLKNSEKRFRDIFLNSPDAIYVENYDGVILDVNEATCRMHECSKEALLGKTIYDLTPKSRQSECSRIQSKIISGDLRNFEAECLTLAGKVVPVEVSAARIDYRDKPAILLHVRDITERHEHQRLLQQLNIELENKVKQRTQELEEANTKLQGEIAENLKFEKELQQQKDYLRLIIDSTPSMIFIKDHTGHFLLANESTAQFYNKTTVEMEGHLDSTEEFSSESLGYFKWQDQQVVESNDVVRFPEQKLINLSSGNGHWIQIIKKPIPSLSGAETDILVVATDVTEIKEAKEKLHISEQLYREIARNLPKAAMFIFDTDMRYILAEGPLIGTISKPKSEIEGKFIHETIRASERERVESVYRKILEGETSEAEQKFFGRYLKVYHIPIKNDIGKIIYGMVMILDISDLKETQRELEKRAAKLQRSNEELERFAYVASHDLQSPLRTIASYLQLLEMRFRDSLDKEALEFIDFSVEGAKRMQTVIQELLSYSRIATTKKPFVNANLNEVVRGVIKNLVSSLKNSGAEVRVGELPKLYCEPTQLYQLFQNLIDNAVKFMDDKKPVVEINAVERDDMWEFTVKDNGIGIRDEFKEKVFQIFQRLHSQAEYPGTGVGLAICKRIVEVHGGRIWVESEPGMGTTFHFTINSHLEAEKDLQE